MTRSALLVLVALLAAAAHAQVPARGTATLAGVVQEAETGEPLPGATVLLTRLGATGVASGDPVGRAATAEGGFLFARLEPGRYVLRASFAGFTPEADTLALMAGDEVSRVIALSPMSLGNAVVEAGGNRQPIQAGRLRLRPADIAALPGPDPAGDLIQAITFQPGVVALGDRGGQLTVRGGTPVQNLVLVDGIPVFQPFHIVGFYSAIPADVVSQADIYAGGYPARYGGRISSVVDVTTRNGSKSRVNASATVAPFLAGLRVEGPVVPGAVSAMVSVRESAVERVGDALGRNFPYAFGDAMAKVHAQLDKTTFLTGTAMRTHDRGTLAGSAGGDAQVSWSNEGAAGRFFSISPAFAAAIDLGAFATRYEARFVPERGPTRSSVARAFGGHFGYVYYLGPHTARAGFGGQTFFFDYTFDEFVGIRRENTTEGHLFVDADIALGRRVVVEPGVRVQTFPSQRRDISVEPRARMTFDAGGGHSFSVAGGLYRQEILGLADQFDVGDGFIAWAPTRQNRGIPRAVHYIGGWEGPVTSALSGGLEVYAKRLNNQELLLSGRGRVQVNGSATGLDARLSYRQGPLALDAVYGLSSTVYLDVFGGAGGTTPGDDGTLPDDGAAPARYRPPHDRRHRARLAARVTARGWTLGTRAEVASGRPYSSIIGSFLDLGPLDSDDYRTDGGTPQIVPAGDNFGSLTPAYLRIDLSAERRFDVGGAGLIVQGALINATDRPNLYTFDLFRGERVDQFRIIPSIGLRLEVE